jgi:DNA replication protein DnaC
MKRLAKISVLIVDDFGLGSLGDRENQDLLEAIEERYRRRVPDRLCC